MRSLATKVLIALVVLSLIAVPMGVSGFSEPQTAIQETAVQAGDAAVVPGSVTDGPVEQAERVSHRLIVELGAPSVSEWATAVGTAAFGPSGEIDLDSAAAKQQVAVIQKEQEAFVSAVASVLPAAKESAYVDENGTRRSLRFQTLMNAVTLDLGEPGVVPTREARAILAKMSGVRAVYLDYAHEPDLYASTPLIGATALWEGASIGGQANAGAGVKIATMDGGVHHEAPMFAGTGFNYPSDFPSGGLGLTENNNGKIIASRAYFRTWDPPATGENTPWPGATGTSHGVHTAGIAAGNPVVADYLGHSESISGVAPAAWVMSYRVFYNSVTGDGSFYTAEGLAALEDIVADGADVLNNSWGGGPTSVGGEFDPLDTALINAANAGIFVSMSAGNAGPGKGSGDHPSDEYITVAASSTDYELASGRLAVVGAENPPLTEIPYAAASFGGTIEPGQVSRFDFVPTTAVAPTNVEGCSAFPGGTFTGKAAMIMRGTCEFGVKALNAQNAGASFVVVYNQPANGDTLTTMAAGAAGGAVTIPAVLIGNTAGAAAALTYPTFNQFDLNTIAFRKAATPDVLASFSSRGPGAGLVLKPDVTAPGVNILSQGYASGVAGEDRHLGFGQASGTSMAAPHVAGAAALLRQVHPSWSNAWIKSALMSSSKFRGIYTSDGTHAQPLDMGAGRIQVDEASDPGVILDPPSLSFGQIEAGSTKSIQVTVTSVAPVTEVYALSAVSVSGNIGDAPTVAPLAGVDVQPGAISLAPGESKTITVTFEAAPGQNGDVQGHLVFDGTVYEPHMPIWVRVQPTPTGADVLIIDNDASFTLDFADYAAVYSSAVAGAGRTFDYWDADAHFGSPTTIPDAATLSTYAAIVYFTGDNYLPNGYFSVRTPLTALDMDRLTEYANGGGTIIAMGQDAASVLASTANATFFYQSVLGGRYLRDSVTDGAQPGLPVVPLSTAPEAFKSLFLDLSQSTIGDGADNQLYIDEIAAKPFKAPDNPLEEMPYTALLEYPGSGNVESGVVAVSHRDQPSLERPGTSYKGRSAYTTFGLEGVNSNLGGTTRSSLMQSLLDWALDEPAVTIVNLTPADNPSGLVHLEANVSSNVAGTTGVTYRWDFGDGTGFHGPYTSKFASYAYSDSSKSHVVRVEVTDSWGNKAVGQGVIGYRVFVPLAVR